MKKVICYSVIYIVLVSWSVGVVAQTADRGLWSTFDLSKKWDNGWKLGFEEEYRLRNQWRTTDKFETTLELSKELLPYLEFGTSYTWIAYFHPSNKNHPHNFFEMRHRFNVFGEASYSWNRFDFSWRERFQSTYRVLDSLSTANINPKWMLRSKISVEYNVRGVPIDPYATVEWFHLLNGEEPFSFAEYRAAAGIKYKITKQFYIKAGYLYSAETVMDDGGKVHVLTVGAGYKL